MNLSLLTIYFCQGRSIPDVSRLTSHVTGWDPYNPHDLARVSWVGSVLCTDPAQPLTAASEELDDLRTVDRDPSEVRSSRLQDFF